LLRSGRMLAGLRRAADGFAHLLLHHPPRLWMSRGTRRRDREARSDGLRRTPA
jgi:hypothetical protein